MLIATGAWRNYGDIVMHALTNVS